MVNTIVICPDGHMIPESDCLGRTGEHKATVLRFEFFKDLNGEAVAELEKNLVAVMPEGALPFRIDGDFYVPRTLTLNPEIILFVEIKKGNDVLFKSIPHVFTLIDTGKTEGADIIGAATETVREECRAELAESLETATGENYDGKTWEELNNTVAELPIITDEQTQALGDWDLIKDYFANYAGKNHHLFATAPKDENGKDMLFKLPYIYTPKLKWNTDIPLSQSLVEVGLDVSSAPDLGYQGGSRTLSPYPNLERLVITGNANAASHSCMLLQNTGLLYVKMETPNEDVLKESSDYYYGTFSGCNKLVTIDCELDLTGQTNTTYMFKDCYKLKNLKIKPFTLFTSLDLGACRSLHHNDLNDYDSLISILNGITHDREVAKNITITFSTEITDFTVGMTRYWNKLVYPCDNGMYYSTPSEVPEGLAYLELELYEAFISKGVTIAWK